MKILVVTATQLEIPEIINKPGERPANGKFLHQAEVLITGVGSVATVFHLTKHLLSNKYDLVLGAGIAGSFNKNLLLGEVVSVQKDCFGDLGVVENERFRSIFDMNLENPDEHPFSDGWVENSHKPNASFELKCVNGCTVNTVSTVPGTISRLVNKYQPDIETMEGAALHYTCKSLNLPFLQLRAVSNMVGERDKSKWSMRLAITNLQSLILKILNSPEPLSYQNSGMNHQTRNTL